MRLYTQTRLHTQRWLLRVILFGGLLLVLYTTLFPFNFSSATPSLAAFTKHRDKNSATDSSGGFCCKTYVQEFKRVDLRLVKPDALSDWPRNILLFMPFGFGFAGLMRTRQHSGTVALVTVLSAGAGLSLCVECLQLFLPVRVSALADILANGIGTGLGFLGFRQWGGETLAYAAAALDACRARLSVKTATLGLIAYATLVGVLLSLPGDTGLRNWDPTFPLILGNELTGDRPWRGYVAEISISDTAISENDLAQVFATTEPGPWQHGSFLASYRFTETQRDPIPDRTGHLPALGWQGMTSGKPNQRGVLITPYHWLKTSTSVAVMTQRLRATGAFTLSAVVATAATWQTGPARIVSISKDPSQRNFTLGQQGTRLILRLRTPATGENGTHPELVVPDIFADTDPHHLIVTYDGSILRLYVDGLKRSYDFKMTPAVAFFRHLRPVDYWQIRMHGFSSLIYRILYYGVLGIPLILSFTFMIGRSYELSGSIHAEDETG